MSNNRILPIPMGVGPSPSEFYTKAEIDTMLQSYAQLVTTDLVNYYLKTETYTQQEIQNLIGQITSFEVVATLPVSDIKTNVIYLLGPIGSGSDRYEEYIYSNNAWVKIGETSIDLSNYVTVTQLNTALSFYTTTLDLNTLLAGKQDTLTAGDGITISSNVISADSNVISMTQAQYDALGTNVNPNAIYIITDATPVTLATVASTGSYNDLTDKPTIPVVPTLATVATTGAYSDLTGTPTIPTVGTGTVTLTSGGATIGTINVNDTADKTIDIPSNAKIELMTLSLQEQLAFYQATLAGTMKDFSQYTANGYPLINAYPINAGVVIDVDGTTYTTDGTEIALLMNQRAYLDNNDEYVNKIHQYLTLFSPTIVQTYGSTIDLTPDIYGASGTNDGTNWTSITIGEDTYGIPQGGGSSSNAWYGSQYQFDTLGTYDADTDYYISDISYSEIKGTPNLSVYETKAASQAADQALDTKIAGKMDPIVFLGTTGLPSIGTPLEGVTYAIEGETLPLTFTLADQSTVTYNFVID